MPMGSGVRRMTYSVEEAAAVLGMSKSTVYDSIRNGELRGVQLGRRVVIPCDALEALVGPIDSTADPSASELRSAESRPNGSLSNQGGAEVNAVHLTGTVVRQPELRLSRTGLEICTLQLAVRRRRRDGEERGALHVDIVAFGPVATVISELVGGEHVAVSGRLGQREWTTSDGSQHARFEVVADEIEVHTSVGCDGA